MSNLARKYQWRSFEWKFLEEYGDTNSRDKPGDVARVRLSPY